MTAQVAPDHTEIAHSSNWTPVTIWADNLNAQVLTYAIDEMRKQFGFYWNVRLCESVRDCDLAIIFDAAPCDAERIEVLAHAHGRHVLVCGHKEALREFSSREKGLHRVAWIRDSSPLALLEALKTYICLRQMEEAWARSKDQALLTGA